MNPLDSTIDRTLASAEPAAEVIAGGNGLRMFRRLSAGTKLYDRAPQASSKDGEEIQKQPAVRAALLAYLARPLDEEAAHVVRAVLAAKVAHSP